MTLTDPRGDPSLLQTVVAHEHEHIEQLLREARVNTPTPGVREQLVGQLIVALGGHLNTEASVVAPEVEHALDADDRERVAGDSRQFRDLLGGRIDDPALDELAAAIADHVALYDGLLRRLGEAVGADRMATLGFEFGRAAETAPTRFPPS